MKEEINFFAQTNFRNQLKKFGIKTDDRRRHFYVVGKTGMGKTEMIKNMAIQDIRNGKGIGFVDPHGEASMELLEFVPKERIKDVIYFNPADLDWPIAFNIMENVAVEHRHLVAGGLMGVFKKIWPDVWSARMEYILNNAILALLEVPGSTLLSINRLFSDADWREKVVGKLKDPVVKAFWVKEFARYSQKYEIEATAAIQNKIGQFVSAPLIRNIIGQPNSTIDMRKIMDGKKILIMNLSKGLTGEDNSRLLGALLITKLQLAAMSRVDMPEEGRNDFYLYVDEFQNFATEAFVNVLSEARKYRLALILANQYIAQLTETSSGGHNTKVRDAVFGNVGTIVLFRVGAEDAEFLEREFSPEFEASDLVNLSKYNIYVKLMINGVASRPFSAQTLMPESYLEKTFKKEIVEFSRKNYSAPRKIIEKNISDLAQITMNGKDQKSGELVEAICQICGKKTMVNFRPDGKRSVFCKACLKRVEKERLEAQMTSQKRTFNGLAGMSLEEATQGEPVSFKKNKEEEPKGREEEKNKKKKKEIKLGELRSVLKGINDKKKNGEKKESDSSDKRQENKPEIGKIDPGEVIKF
ncbi:MAG: type IV secretion system DNA-binding domain-containing protein [Candidatus Pacebacteria bacterium]|nr:type IV secretion system DNA-binding domain-containing protein [Candidatus Paceibacterota bacterium]MDD4875315.1 type IV secretion system DNA-binding domain-containing protein [Candidatus Paceibacterota bacterium]